MSTLQGKKYNKKDAVFQWLQCIFWSQVLVITFQWFNIYKSHTQTNVYTNRLANIIDERFLPNSNGI